MSSKELPSDSPESSPKNENSNLRAVATKLSIKKRRTVKVERSRSGSAEEANINEKDSTEGKDKSPNGTALPKPRGLQRLLHRHERSIGSSPLATELTNGPAQAGDGASDINKAASLQSSDSSTPQNESIRWTDSGRSTARKSNTLGLDADSTQLVNIALSLGESRRRNVSGGTFMLGRDGQSSNRRVTSSGSRLSYPSYGTTGEATRQQTSSPQSRKATPIKRQSSSASPQPQKAQVRVPFFIGEDLDDEDVDVLSKASDATIARVERAKEAFELIYEYRRLLQYLPELPVTAANPAQTRRPSKKTGTTTSRTIGREYNPLQYVRNRKLRLRERRGLDAESKGWTHVERVRSWVDAVKQDHDDDMSSIDGTLQLPPFDPINVDDAALEIPVNGAIKRHVPRPRNDWTFHPSWLLADINWRFQENNLKKMEDSLGRKFFDTGSHFNTPTRLSKESLREMRSSASLSRFRPSALSHDDLSDRSDRDIPDRNHGKSDLKHEGGDRGRKARWTRGFMRSRDPSLSNDSAGEESLKTRPKHHTEREHMDNIALEKQMMDMLAHEDQEGPQSPSSPEVTTISPIQTRSPLEGSPPNDKATPNSPPRPRIHRLKTDLPSNAKQFSPPRASLDDQVLQRRKSSEGFVTTNPSSPTRSGFIPSIAINFSPPESPKQKPTSPVRPTSSRFKSFRWNKGAAAPPPMVSDHDFAAQPSLPEAGFHFTEAQAGDTKEVGGRSSLERANGFLTPEKSKAKGGKSGVHESVSAKDLKDGNENESRLRGFLKAGKMVDMVGNQVSRAGDAFRKKDRGKRRHTSSSTSPSSSDSENDADVESSPYDLSRATTNNEPLGNLSRTSTRPNRPKYFMDNLPSFKSPADRRDPSPKSPKASPERDPVRAQQLEQKQRGRPQRFEQNAPPKIGIRNGSTSPSPSGSRSQSRTTGDGYTRDSSGSRAGSRMTSHHRLNDMLGIPGQVGTITKGPSPTGLSSLDPQPSTTTPLTARPTLEGKRQWSITDRRMSLTTAPVTAKDITRVRALLLTSGVKAAEITRQANHTPQSLSTLLSTIPSHLLPSPLTPTPQVSEHLTAGRALLASIDLSHTHLQDSSTSFTETILRDLHASLSRIDARVTNSLTPLVRGQADQADAASAELSSSRTLDVKNLSDRVDLILRRRRRRRRWMIRSVWTVLEWAVLALMWAVWGVVVGLRVLRGVVWAPWGVLRWLFCF